MSSEEEKYYVISETGFGGRLFRMAERYIEKGGEVKKTASNSRSADNAYLSLTTRESPSGKLYTVSARSSKRVNVALLQPSDDADFVNFAESRTPKNGKINPAEIPITASDPVEFTLSILARIIAEQETETPLALFSKVIERESVFPTQNLPEIIRRAQMRQQQNQQFKFACFACLDFKCVVQNNRPFYYLGQEENRLETPRLYRKTQTLTSALSQTGIAYNLDILLADNDPFDIYSEWLTNSDQKSAISHYAARLRQKLGNISPSVGLKLWSEVQSPYQAQYYQDFNAAYTSLDLLVGEDYIQSSIRRRLAYFDKLGIKTDAEIIRICDLTAKRNVSLYAAQGPILNKEYDALIISDPDPTRLGKIQSLLCPDLPIWYPYSG